MTPVVERFRHLHESGVFTIPNPWDVGSARWLRAAGFKALATTSAGFAFSQGHPDQDVPRDMILKHIAEIVASVPDVPVNADFENGYADDPKGVAENVHLCLQTGVAGLSIEDATGRPENPLYEFPLAVERVRAAREAIDKAGSGVLLTGRAECFLTGHPDPLNEAVKRIAAYAEAGAHVVYAPGLRTRDEIAAVVEAAEGRPVNMLMFGDLGFSVDELGGLGVRRISVGGALARAAWAAFMRTARLIQKEGSFAGFKHNVSGAELDAFFREDLKAREAHR
jgi:2-methylisocitrate lyase-like PEP mutase family enzyme